MKLYITRHGKTQWNIESRFQGVKDSPLVQTGIDDAKRLHDYLIDETFDYVYTSPLGRAKQTCKLIFENRDILIKEDKRILEMNFGCFEGMKTEDIFKEYGELYDNLWNHPEKFTVCPGGGETFRDVRNRVEDFISEMKTLKDDQKVFIVTHGMYFICLLGYLMGYEPVDFPKINRHVVRGCSLTIVDITNDQITIECVGKDDYLPQEEKSTYVIKQQK